jgi:Methyltransferase domain
MPSWVLKAALQKSMSFFPNPQSINYLFQKHVTKNIIMNENEIIDKIKSNFRHVSNFFEMAKEPKQDFNAIELGTGWMPVLPLVLYLCGAKNIWSVDILPLLKDENIKQTLHFFVQIAKSGEMKNILPHIKQDRLDYLIDIYDSDKDIQKESLLKKLNINIIIGDARNIDLPDSSVDLFVSNNTLEHIPYEVIFNIFKEFRRLASSGSIMSHDIDMSDHFSHFDHSISKGHFYKFSENTWRSITCSLNYHNRLRHEDFQELHKKAGFSILKENNFQDIETTLENLRIDKMFQKYSDEQLLIYKSFIVSK